MPFNHDTVSVLICRKETVAFNEMNFLFQVAWQYAEKGFLVFILSKNDDNTSCDICFSSSNARPEILQRIIFRYFSEPSEVLQWCHEMHKRSRIPKIFLMGGLERLCSPNEFIAVEMCAALLDSIQYCSSKIRKPTYLLVSICCEKGDRFPIHMLTIFDRIWKLERSENNKHIFSQLHPSIPGNPLKTINLQIT